MHSNGSADGGTRELTYAEALREALRQTMAEDERVFLIGEDIGI